ncbi:hypothetical protein [Nitrococcus mobilis]|uniref:hypothetical protein n=1 Tax=Nitrococcus mobilis TaxID=35797 RepID=UPI001E583784|nr:hypothetical protein [Nitrococcus mobilis]
MANTVLQRSRHGQARAAELGAWTNCCARQRGRSGTAAQNHQGYCTDAGRLQVGEQHAARFYDDATQAAEVPA